MPAESNAIESTPPFGVHEGACPNVYDSLVAVNAAPKYGESTEGVLADFGCLRPL